MKCARTTEQKTDLFPLYSSLAQSVERMTVNHDVAGSSPAGGAIQELSETDACRQRFRISCLYIQLI